MPLNPDKLQSYKVLGGGDAQSACPACCEKGTSPNDLHLRIFATGAYGCAVDRSKEHSRRIFQLAGIGGDDSFVFVSPEPKVEVPRTWPLESLKRLINDTTYWNGRGISDATLAPFRGGVATTGQMAMRYTFPLFNDAGEIIGFNGRRVDGKPEKPWKIIGPSSQFVWGGVEEVRQMREVVLVESGGDMLMLREHGVPHSLVLFGTNLSNTLLAKLITFNPRRIIISTNADTERTAPDGRKYRPGQDAAESIGLKLSPFFDLDMVEIRFPPREKDWGKSSRDDIRATFGLDKQTNLTTVEPS